MPYRLDPVQPSKQFSFTSPPSSLRLTSPRRCTAVEARHAIIFIASSMSATAAKELRMVQPKQNTDKKGPVKYPFWFGGSASSFAACVTHPLDLGTKRTPSWNHTYAN